MIWGKVYDLNTRTPIDLAMFPSDGLPKTHPLFPNPSGQESQISVKKGILMTERGPMMVSSLPILKSNGDGPARGMLVMGRFLDEGLIAHLAWQTQVECAILPISADAAFPDGNKIEDRFSPESPYLIDYTDSDRLNIQSLYRDIQGNPAFLINLNIPRTIAHKGYETVRIGVYSILIAGFGILLMVLVILKWTILNPLSRLTGHVLDIKQSGDFSKRLRMLQKDEIGILSQEFDNVVTVVGKTTKKLAEANVQLQKDNEMRMQIVSALQESEERFRAVVDQAAEAVILHDWNGSIRMVNQVACARLGFESKDLLQMNMADVDPDFDYRKEKERFQEKIAEKTPIIFEGRHKGKNNSILPVEVSLSPIQYRGEFLFLSIARDITRRKLMEKQLRYAQKMDALRTLTAGIAHNFNNILTIIIGCTGLAKQKVTEDMPIHGLIHKIEKAGLRAREIVWQLINFSHPAGDCVTPLPIHQVIADAIDKLKASAPAAIHVNKHISPDCHPVLGNVGHIHQMIANLWNNAVEALSDAGGEIDIGVENVSLDATKTDIHPDLKSGKYVKITIRDSGCGIDPAVLDNIFDPYFSTKDFANGAGMGLSIVHGIVKSNDGSILVESRLGHGTCVSIFFPAEENNGVKFVTSPRPTPE